MKPGVSFWVQKDENSDEFVGLTSYSGYLSHLAATPETAMIGIISLTLECLVDKQAELVWSSNK